VINDVYGCGSVTMETVVWEINSLCRQMKLMEDQLESLERRLERSGVLKEEAEEQ
jgi:hypothetical protein